ncbi:hypothetical protein [Micromonospora sp. NPDC049679]|uniref:hypothetical protein n=1 Tax=Micromonospora sp. NPDC049679 TaxID=3155920 RepID=UPI0034020D9D
MGYRDEVTRRLRRAYRTGLFGVVFVVLLLGGVAAVVLKKNPLWCTAPQHQSDLLTAYGSDPLYNVAPPGGRLVEESKAVGACRPPAVGKEVRGPYDGVSLHRRYETERLLSLREVSDLYGPVARSDGWRLIATPQLPTEGAFRFCKPTPASVAELQVSVWRGNPAGLSVVMSTDLEHTTSCPDPVDALSFGG